VSDHGPGIPPELRQAIFTRFARADTVRTRRSSGAGLGLAVSAALAEAHGGSLELVDGDEPGCVFRLTLPGRELPT
jgi:two-component system OmpR family sensor kinase